MAALAVCLLAAASCAWAQLGSNVTLTKHNLTSGGPGPVRVAGTTEVCKFCHTPHAANPIGPLWNRQDKGTYYKTYESSTLVARVGQPTGSSRLCLSCHDGTIALTQTYNSRNMPQGSVFISANDKGYLSTDLSDDHPISFVYDSALAGLKGQLNNPGSLPRELYLDSDRQLQCTTCHDPHDDKFGKFLVMDNTQSRLCQSCHNLDEWTTSAHATASASLAGSREVWDNLKAATVRQAACESCHRPHNAGGKHRLLRHEAEEDNCLSCHDGTVAPANIRAELAKASVHPMNLATGIHNPKEDPRTMRPHVECVDCHSPHRALKGATARAPFLPAVMKGAAGANGSGSPVSPALYEYQVCYKCHAGANLVHAAAVVIRVIPNADLGQLFSPNNPSYHPIEAVGKNINVPSLSQPLTITSRIYCTDCHGSDSPEARGPHGSRNRPLLVRRYDTADNTPESPQAYALCYGCHERNSILGNQSFPLHRLHVVGEKAPCSACHDSHGNSATQVNAANGTHLINFDSRIVQPSRIAGTGPTFTDQGMFRGSCTLLCHNVDHVNFSYGGGGIGGAGGRGGRGTGRVGAGGGIGGGPGNTGGSKIPPRKRGS